MPYQATVVNVMIAAPSDVEKEPVIIREILEEWNETDAEHSRIVALPIGWQTHASPESGERAQEIINRQVLEKADILVAVFWTRLGTPSGEYDSGTVEEINKSIQDRRHVMLYFSDASIPPSKVDRIQHDKLIAFREEMMSRALCGMFSDPDDFKAKFRRDIRNKLQEIEKSLPRPDAENAKDSTLEQPPLEKGLRVLLRAYELACQEKKAGWDFAVGIPELRDLGLHDSDFRLLVHKGYVEHAEEFTRPGYVGRGFMQRGDLTAKTCFILTKKGVEYARTSLAAGRNE